MSTPGSMLNEYPLGQNGCVWVNRVLALLSVPTNSALTRVAFSPDGGLLVATTSVGNLGIYLWDGRQSTEQLRRDREAATALRVASDRLPIRIEIAAALSENPTLTDAVRARALEWVALYQEDAIPLNYAAWRIVCATDRTREEYVRALNFAQIARGRPFANRYLSNVGNALGAAQYRVGRYKDAIATLSSSDVTARGYPADLAFLAMSQHRVEPGGAARTTLNRLRVVLKQPRSVDDLESKSLLAEAEALIDPPPR
jgi:hypothetical protein